MKTIDKFSDTYEFLSNMYEAPVCYQGITYNNSESAYQAQKNPDEIQKFIGITGYAAKKLGRKINMRPDFDTVKLQIMYEIVLAKFSQNSDIRQKLMGTKDAILIEGNYWHDHFWGICDNAGKNHLGKILMQVREELRKADTL